MATPHRWDQICDLFSAVLRVAPADRERLLAELCGGDPLLQEEVRALVNHEAQARGFLDQPHPANALAGFPPMSSTPRLSPGEVLAGRFVIQRFIGRGGMGEVYEAEDLDLGERVALKTLRQELAGDATLARFKQELQLARRITHPNVCRVFDLAKHPLANHNESGGGDWLHFLTMELLTGETLAERLDRGRLPRVEALNAAEQIGGGLAAAHKLGIVHRDLKSANVMLVAAEEGKTRAMVMDFGLALSSSAGAAEAQDGLYIAGTPLYMAPEQFAGGEITPATDIYSFGVLLHEMLTGVRPLGKESLSRVIEEFERNVHTPADPLPGALDRRCAKVILRCLQEKPKDRYQDFPELLDDLLARRRLLSRRRWAVAAVAALGAGSWFVVRPKPAPGRGTSNSEAFNLYQKGRLHQRRLTTEDLNRAVEYFDQAIRLDPKFALAHSARADAFSQLADYGGGSQTYAANQAIASGRRGVELAPELAETQAAWGLALSNNLAEWRNAESAFEKAIRLDPKYASAHHWYGAYLARLGRTREAIDQLRTATSLDPVNLPMSAVLGFMYYFDREYSEAVDQGLRTVDLDPNFRYGYLLLARAYTGLRQFDDARKACQRGIDLSGNAPVFASASACIYAEAGERHQAERIAADLERRQSAEHIPALYIATVYSLLGNGGKTYAWLRRGWQDGESSILMVRAYPQFDAIRADPRYPTLLSDFHLR